MQLDLSGVNPANVVPFMEGGDALHEDDLYEHLDELGSLDVVNGIVTNGHAGEVYALTDNERVRVVELAVDATDADTPVIAGVVGGSTDEVITATHRVTDAGADGILLIPPHTPINNHARASRDFFQAIAEAATIPIVIFQHPTWAGGSYDSQLLADLASIDNVVAVKDAIWDVDHFQDDFRALRDSDADVQLLVGNDEHLLPSFALGTDGAVLELAAVIPHHIADLYDAVETGDIEEARTIYQQIEPFVDAMYEPPITDSHTRLKVALQLQGKIESATPRRPAVPISDDEIAAIEPAMKESGLL